MYEINLPPYKLIRKIMDERIDQGLQAISTPGSSGSKVYILRDPETEKLYAVKCIKSPRIDLNREKERRDLLNEFYHGHLPEIILVTSHDDVQIMISECIGPSTLFEMITNGLLSQEELTQIWGNLLNKAVDVWINSAQQFVGDLSPRNYEARLVRVSNGIDEFLLKNQFDLKVKAQDLKIGGVNYPSINELLSYISNYIAPRLGVTCHGDLNPSNVIVGVDNNWHLIDWEWSGANHDWRGMISHLHGWWLTRHCIVMEHPEIHVKAGQLRIKTGKVELPKYVAKYIKLVQDIFKRVAKSTLGNQYDSLQTSKFLSMLYLGEIRFVSLWRREVIIPYLFKIAAQELINPSFGASSIVENKTTKPIKKLEPM